MEYNKDAVRLVKPYVDSKVATATSTALTALAALFKGTGSAVPEDGTVGQLFIVAGAEDGNGLYVCTAAPDGDTAAVWSAVSYATGE